MSVEHGTITGDICHPEAPVQLQFEGNIFLASNAIEASKWHVTSLLSTGSESSG